MFAIRDVTVEPLRPTALAALADLKAMPGVSGATDEALTALLVTVSQAVELYCNDVFSLRTVTEIIMAQDDMTNMLLRYTPANTLDAITYNAGGAEITANVADYRVLKGLGALRRVDGTLIPAATWTVTYEAGYAADAIPPAIQRAVIEFAREMFVAQKAGRSAGVTSETVPDVGSTDYASGGIYAGGDMGPTGARVPLQVAALLGPFVNNFMP